MRVHRLFAGGAAVAAMVMVVAACSSAGSSAGGDAGGPTPNGPSGPNGPDGPIGPNGGDDASDRNDAASDGATNDDATATDAGTDAEVDATVDAGEDADGGGIVVDPGQPGILTIGRFDTSDPNNLKFAWPGASIVARFDGTAASVTLSQANGFSGGPSWFNVIVDDVQTTTFSVTGANQTISLASGLAAGTHKVEIQKRTEANLGTVTFSGFTFSGGAGLLEPPARQTKRIEWLTDSTMDGFGVDGNRLVAGQCNGNPPQYNNARESIAWFTSSGLDAEMMMLSYSGKGLTKGGSPFYPVIYPRTLPESAASTWDFGNFPPDVVVISLGGEDVDPSSPPVADATTLKNAYNNLVGTIRGHYPNAYIFATVWSQIKTYNGARQALQAAINYTVTTRNNAGDNRVFAYSFPEADVNTNETACAYHANAAHHQAMADLLKAQIQATVPGF